MEDDLDEISRRRARVARVPEAVLLRRQEAPWPAAGRRARGRERGLPAASTLGTDPESGEADARPHRTLRAVRAGRRRRPGKTASLPDDVAPADLTVERALELVRAKAEGPRTLGVDPETGQNVYVMNGRFGAYVQLGEDAGRGKGKARRRSRSAHRCRPGMTEATVTLDEALKLLSLPRVVGLHPDDGEPISHELRPLRSVREARRRFRSLESEDDVFKIAFDAALELLRSAEAVAAPAGAQKKVLRELAARAATTLQVLAGRYGPYVTDGTTNASMPEGHRRRRR